MTLTEDWSRFGARHRVAWFVLVGVVDLWIALALATGFWLTAGVFAMSETYPPTCSNYFGNEVDCALDTPLVVLRWTLTGVLFLLLLSLHSRLKPGKVCS